MMWNRKEDLKRQQQSILFLCESGLERNFTVQIDYRFQLSEYSLRSQALQCRVAFIERHKTLAELMFKNGQEIDVLDWQESLDFGKVEWFSSLDKEAEDEYWILNIVLKEKDGQLDEEEDEFAKDGEELEELTTENSKIRWEEDDFDNINSEDDHHDTSDDEDPRPKKRRKGCL
jgi:hypothetical protein